MNHSIAAQCRYGRRFDVFEDNFLPEINRHLYQNVDPVGQDCYNVDSVAGSRTML